MFDAFVACKHVNSFWSRFSTFHFLNWFTPIYFYFATFYSQAFNHFFLQTRQQGSPFLSDLKDKMLLAPNEAASAGTRYNVPLINSLVLYVGMQVL